MIFKKFVFFNSFAYSLLFSLHESFLVELIKTISKVSELRWAECSSVAGQDSAARAASLG